MKSGISSSLCVQIGCKYTYVEKWVWIMKIHINFNVVLFQICVVNACIICLISLIPILWLMWQYFELFSWDSSCLLRDWVDKFCLFSYIHFKPWMDEFDFNSHAVDFDFSYWYAFGAHCVDTVCVKGKREIKRKLNFSFIVLYLFFRPDPWK